MSVDTEHYSDPSSYNREQQQKAEAKRMSEIATAIAGVETSIKRNPKRTLFQIMDLLEEVVRNCGGEPKLKFLDVSPTYIKIFTRVPIEANLFQFLKTETQDNPRYHKVVTKLLMQCSTIKEVRWIESESTRGAYLLVGLCLDAPREILP